MEPGWEPFHEDFLNFPTRPKKKKANTISKLRKNLYNYNKQD